MLTNACLMPCPDITGSICLLPGVMGEVKLCRVLQDCAAGTIALQTAVSLCLSLQLCLFDIVHRPVCGMPQPCDYVALFEAAAGTAVGPSFVCGLLQACLLPGFAMAADPAVLMQEDRIIHVMFCAIVTDIWRACVSKFAAYCQKQSVCMTLKGDVGTYKACTACFVELAAAVPLIGCLWQLLSRLSIHSACHTHQLPQGCYSCFKLLLHLIYHLYLQFCSMHNPVPYTVLLDPTCGRM